jgi:integrase
MSKSKRSEKQKVKSRGNGRGTVYKLPDGRFRWQLRNAEGKTLKSGIAADRTKAEKMLAQAISDNARGILASPDQVTLGEYAKQWLERHTAKEITKLGYQRELGKITPILGKYRIKDLKAPQLRDALHLLANTPNKDGSQIASRTISHVRTRLRSLFREAIVDQIIYVNPMEGVRPVKKVRTERPHKSLDFDELAYLYELGCQLHQIGLCRLWVAVLTAVSVGLRKSEVMGLRWTDINLETGRMLIRHTAVTYNGKTTRSELTKTDHSRREILLPPTLKAALEQHRQKQLEEREAAGEFWEETDAVFATSLGQWTHPDNLKCALEDIVKWSNLTFYMQPSKRGIARGHSMIPAIYCRSLEALLAANKPLPHLTPHDLRHTAGTLTRYPLRSSAKPWVMPTLPLPTKSTDTFSNPNGKNT